MTPTCNAFHWLSLAHAYVMCSVGLGSPGGHFPVGTPTVALESHARILGRYVIDLPFYT